MNKPITFKKGGFQIALTTTLSKKAIPYTVLGHVSSDGAWGIHKDQFHGWRITHLATGRRAGPDFSRLCNAKRYTKVMASRPDLWRVDGDRNFGRHPAWATNGLDPERADVVREARAAGGVK